MFRIIRQWWPELTIWERVQLVIGLTFGYIMAGWTVYLLIDHFIGGN